MSGVPFNPAELLFNAARRALKDRNPGSAPPAADATRVSGAPQPEQVQPTHAQSIPFQETMKDMPAALVQNTLPGQIAAGFNRGAAHQSQWLENARTRTDLVPGAKTFGMLTGLGEPDPGDVFKALVILGGVPGAMKLSKKSVSLGKLTDDIVSVGGGKLSSRGSDLHLVSESGMPMRTGIREKQYYIRATQSNGSGRPIIEIETAYRPNNDGTHTVIISVENMLTEYDDPYGKLIPPETLGVLGPSRTRKIGQEIIDDAKEMGIMVREFEGIRISGATSAAKANRRVPAKLIERGRPRETIGTDLSYSFVDQFNKIIEG